MKWPNFFHWDCGNLLLFPDQPIQLCWHLDISYIETRVHRLVFISIHLLLVFIINNNNTPLPSILLRIFHLFFHFSLSLSPFFLSVANLSNIENAIKHSSRFISKNFVPWSYGLEKLALRNRKISHSRFVRDSIEWVAFLAIGSISFSAFPWAFVDGNTVERYIRSMLMNIFNSSL